MGIRFMPTKTFDAVVNGNNNNYLRGQMYTVHDTPAHAELAQLVEKWDKEGRVIITGQTAGRSVPVQIITKPKPAGN